MIFVKQNLSTFMNHLRIVSCINALLNVLEELQLQEFLKSNLVSKLRNSRVFCVDILKLMHYSKTLKRKCKKKYYFSLMSKTFTSHLEFKTFIQFVLRYLNAFVNLFNLINFPKC